MRLSLFARACSLVAVLAVGCGPDTPAPPSSAGTPGVAVDPGPAGKGATKAAKGAAAKAMIKGGMSLDGPPPER